MDVKKRSRLDSLGVGYVMVSTVIVGMMVSTVMVGLLNSLVLCCAGQAWADEIRSDRLLQPHLANGTALSKAALSKTVQRPRQHLAPQNVVPQSLTLQNLMAQSLVGQCRQTGRLERIYDAADLAASTVGDLDAGVMITLAGEVNQPAFGWIRISAPFDGYIQTPFLTGCNEGISPSLNCGIVTQPELALKPSASTLSDPIGALLFEQGFNIVGAPQMQRYPPSQAGRMWVPVDRFGLTGWVTETAPDGYSNNFRRVPCASIGLEPVG